MCIIYACCASVMSPTSICFCRWNCPSIYHMSFIWWSNLNLIELKLQDKQHNNLMYGMTRFKKKRKTGAKQLKKKTFLRCLLLLLMSSWQTVIMVYWSNLLQWAFTKAILQTKQKRMAKEKMTVQSGRAFQFDLSRLLLVNQCTSIKLLRPNFLTF